MNITITIDGVPYKAEQGENLAALMLREGLRSFRTHPIDQSDRTPFCMMGICFECLVEVNGVPSRQACLLAAEDGMIVRRNLDV